MSIITSGVETWSTDPDLNGTIGGINIAENCPAANINNSLRYVAAAVRVFYNGVPNGDAYVTKNGGVFLTQPTFSGRGAFLHHNDPLNASGRIFIQAAGGSAPAGMQNGDFLLEY
ncbi:hypothetical protein [Sphingomonas melonis]|uniref:hypothetical protein n=1 Tax=Sphingomonas melonis TaxID=152682 RepID=UPI0036DB8342